MHRATQVDGTIDQINAPRTLHLAHLHHHHDEDYLIPPHPSDDPCLVNLYSEWNWSSKDKDAYLDSVKRYIHMNHFPCPFGHR